MNNTAATKQTTSREKMTWTLRSVNRPTVDGWGFLVVRAAYNERADTFSFEIDGQKVEWYRRGMPMFDTWAEGCAYVRKHGWPLNEDGLLPGANRPAAETAA